MILNISGRTDIVAFYTPWLLKRLEEGFVDVRNPFYEKQVSRIYFKNVDAIVFCTKNPIPILKHLDKFKKPILFHVTLTPYQKDIEPNIPPKGKIIEAVHELVRILGSERVYLRYDPIFISEKYTLEYHLKSFELLCKHVNGSVKHIIVSFLDPYKNVKENRKYIQNRQMTEKDYEEIGIHFSETAKKYHMTVQTCFEHRNLVEYGFQEDACVSKQIARELTGKTHFKMWQARKCGCVEMVDIGVYNTCSHFCKYCYANYDEGKVRKNKEQHDVNSSLLIGHLCDDDIIKERR